MNKIILIFVLCILLITASCGTNKKDLNIQNVRTLFKGNEGLKLSFLRNAPPNRIYEDTDFISILKIENKGAYDIGIDEIEEKGILVISAEIGYVDLKGFEEVDGIIIDENQKANFEVRGKSLANEKGDFITATALLHSRKLPSPSSLFSSTIFATTCYPYETSLTASICVDSDFNNIEPKEKACQVKDLVFSGGQGAPVSITKIETLFSKFGEDKIKPIFLIYIENKGNGQIIKKSKYKEACSNEIKINKDDQLQKAFNIIEINAELPNNKFNCKKNENDPDFSISGKSGIIRCVAPEMEFQEEAYISPFTVTLSYGYTDTISKQFNIEKIKK